MRKKALWGLALIVLIGLVIGMVYWQSFVGRMTTSILKSNYQIQLDHSGLSFSLRGNVVCQQLRLTDLVYPGLETFINAGSLGINVNTSRLLFGHFEVEALTAKNGRVEVNRLDDGSLHLAHVLQRFVPQALPQSATGSVNEAQRKAGEAAAPQPSQPAAANGEDSPSQNPLKIPSMKLQDSVIHHTDQEGNEFEVEISQLTVSPKKDTVVIQQAQAQRNGGMPAILQIDSLKIDDALNWGKHPISVEGSGLVFNGRETSPGQYDFKQSWDVWKGIIDEVVSVFSSPQSDNKSQTDHSSNIAVDTLNLSDVSLSLQPAEGPGPIRLHLDQLVLREGQQAEIQSLKLEEAGQPTVTIKSVQVTGLQNAQAPVEVVNLEGLEVNLREGDQGALNVVRIVERVQGVFQAFFPQETQTASADLSSIWLAGLQNADVQDVQINYIQPEDPTRQIALERMQYKAENRVAQFDTLRLQGPQPELNQFQMAGLTAVLHGTDTLKTLDSLLIDRLELKTERNPQGFTLSTYFDPWLELTNKLAPETAAPSTQDRSEPLLTITNFKMQQSQAEIVDVSGERRVSHQFNPINLSWNDAVIGGEANQRGPITMNLAMVAPARCSIQLQGKAAASLDKLNGDVTFNGTCDTLTGFQPYLADNIFQIQQGGLTTQGRMQIDDNVLNTTFDVTLLNPKFKIRENTGLQLDSKMALSALNRLRNNDGHIQLKNIQIKGDIANPQFRLASTFFDVLSRNVLKTMFNIPGLAIDLAGTGKNIIEGTIKGIGGGAANIIKGVLGGGSDKTP